MQRKEIAQRACPLTTSAGACSPSGARRAANSFLAMLALVMIWLSPFFAPLVKLKMAPRGPIRQAGRLPGDLRHHPA